jgi:hypothetical protein
MQNGIRRKIVNSSLIEDNDVQFIRLTSPTEEAQTDYTCSNPDCCRRCDSGDNYCAWCGEKLGTVSPYTTQELTWPQNQESDQDAITEELPLVPYDDQEYLAESIETRREEALYTCKKVQRFLIYDLTNLDGSYQKSLIETNQAIKIEIKMQRSETLTNMEARLWQFLVNIKQLREDEFGNQS